MKQKKWKFDWWLTGICFSRVFTGLVFMTYAAALSVLQREWGMSSASAGSISSGFNFGYAVSLVIFSSLADRVGAKPLYLGSICAGAVLSLAFALFARDYLSALILYTLVGISLGGTYTTGIMIIANQYPVRRRGMAVGFYIAGTSLGYTLSLLISGMALPLGGYKLSFILTCLGPLAGSILAWITLKETHVPVQKRQKKETFSKEVLGNRPAMLLIGGYTFHTWELLGMWAWTPAFISSCLVYGGSEKLFAAGLGSYISALFHITGWLASFSMGMLSDRLGRARIIIMLSAISSACSFVFGWSFGWPIIVVIGIGMIYAFSSLGDSPVLSAALTETVEPSYLGSAFGLRSLFGFGAGAISPLVFGFILDLTNSMNSNLEHRGWGWAYSMLGLSGICAIVAGYLFSITQRNSKSARKQEGEESEPR